VNQQAEDRLRTTVDAEVYSAEILRSSERIRKVSWEAGHLPREQEGACDPLFFLASVDENKWAPVAVVVVRAGRTVGIVYAKERKFLGIPIGLIYADATLDAMVTASPADCEPVLNAALRELLDDSRTRGLRIVIPPTGFERDAIRRILEWRPLDVYCASFQNHCVVDLPFSYEAFLDKLSKRTRRNFRYYRRRFEAASGAYIEEVPPAEFQRVAFDLLQKHVVGADHNGIERALRMIAAARHPILAGLRGANGEWLGILGGWYEFDRAVVFFQMNNDRDYRQSALSTVLRGYLIEGLIARNIPTLLFWGGTGGPLVRYCRYLPSVCVHLDTPTFTWRALRSLVGMIVRFLPASLRVSASWLAPRAHDTEIV